MNRKVTAISKSVLISLETAEAAAHEAARGLEVLVADLFADMKAAEGFARLAAYERYFDASIQLADANRLADALTAQADDFAAMFNTWDEAHRIEARL